MNKNKKDDLLESLREQPDESLLFPFGRDDKSILKVVLDEVVINGEGTNLREAYTKAFDDLKKVIYQKFNNYIIHVEPMDIIQMVEDSDLKTKKMLGFVPHKKMVYQVKLKVLVAVKYLEV